MGKSSYLCGRCKHLATFTCNCCDGTNCFVEDLNRRPTRFDYTGKETTMSTIDNIRWHVEGVEIERYFGGEDEIRVKLGGTIEGPVTQKDLTTLDRVLDRKLNGRPKMNVYPANPCYGITKPKPFAVKNVIFNDPATVVFWEDGTKTVVKAQDEPYDPEKGLAMAFSKKMFGNEGNYYNNFKQWLEPYYEKENEDTLKRLRESFARITTSLAALKIPSCNVQMELYRNFEEEVAEKEKYNPVEEAYMQINNFLDGNGSLDLNEIRGLLGEALE